MAKLTAQRQIRGRVAEQIGVKQRRVPTRPIISKQPTVKQLQEEFVKKETAKVDAEISSYQSDIAEYRDKQSRLEGGDRAKFNQLEDDIAFANRQIRALSQSKQYIRQGAGFADVTSFATAKTRAEIENIQTAKAAGYSSVSEYRKAMEDIVSYVDPRTGKTVVTSKEGFRRIQDDFDKTPRVIAEPSGATVPTREEIINKYFTTPGASTLPTSTAQISYFKRGLELYGKAEAATSGKLYDITGFSQGQHDIQRQRVIESGELLQSRVSESSDILRSKGVPEPIIKIGGGIARFGVGAGTWISGAVGTIGKSTMDKPILTTATPVALGAAGATAGLGITGFGAAFGGSGGLAATGAFGGGASALFVPTLQVGGTALTAAFVAKKGIDIYSAPTGFERGGIFGETVLEVGAVGGGFASGRKGAAKIGDWWRTKGRTEIATEDIILPEVLSGKKKFVESYAYGYKGSPSGKAKQQFDIKVFEQKPYAYHVTPSQYWKGEFTTVKGTSEVPGLYTAPSPSIYFAKVDPSKTSYRLFGTGLESPGKPAVAQVYTEFSTKQGFDKAFVTGMKPEIEAVIAPGKTFEKVGGEFFFRFGGRRIPIDVFKTTGGKPTSQTGGSIFGRSASGSSVYNIPSQSIYSPVSYTLSSVFSSISSYRSGSASYKPSGAYSSKPSTSYKSSGSYRPSGSISYSPSSPPSKAPPSRPSGSSIVSNISSYFGSGGGSSYRSKLPPTSTKTPRGIISPSSYRKRAQTGVSYMPQVRSRKKWLNVSNRTMTRQGALSRASDVADNSTSRRMRIVQRNVPPQNMSFGNWGMRSYKFRPHRIQKGQQIKLPNSYIEKTSFAIDSVGEKNQLSAAAYAKRKGYLKPSKKKKRRSQWLF